MRSTGGGGSFHLHKARLEDTVHRIARPMPTQIYGDAFFSSFRQDSLRSAEIIVPLIDNLVHPRSVVDIGCGLGLWLSVFKKQGVSRVLGIDGDYIAREQMLLTNDEFMAVDLSTPFHLEDIFDLAICLEVAEHLPPSSARGFVDSLTRLAPYVLFSAATPGQAGTSHLNLQWPDYWHRLFDHAGFVALDPIRPLIWQDYRVAWWYRQNCFLYASADMVSADANLKDLANNHTRNELLLIHRGVLDANLSVPCSLRRMPGQLIAFLFKQIRSRQR